jgi:DNA-binding XRE family transcriptional regulator
MNNLYLPYEVSFDDDSRTFCCEGIDRNGKPFGVGSGATLEIAVNRLRESVFDSLIADASDGNDHTTSFHRTPRGDDFILLTAQDLLPIHIRLIRSTRRLKQVEVAERMGISQQAYSKLEQAGANPTLALVARLEMALQQEILQMV